MRRMIRTTGIAAASFVLVLGVAGATDRADQQPESRAYIGFAFGGAKVLPRNFHYGLRMDHDSRFLERGSDAGLPPLMQFDFTTRGLADARLNGLSVLKSSYKLQQAEEAPAEEPPAESAPAEEAPPAESPPPVEEGAPAEGGEAAAAAGGGEAAAEKGFFSRMWDNVTGIFGGGEEDTAEAEAPAEAPPAEAAAEGGEAAASGEVAEGAFMNYGIVDWGLLALGAVGVGLAASEVSGGDEDADGPNGVQGNTSSTTGTPPPTCTFFPTTTTCIPSTLTGSPGRWTTAFDTRSGDAEYQKWLDGGTGQMGDLGGQ